MSKLLLANNKVIQISPGVILGESSGGGGSAYAITYSVVSNGSFSGVNAALPGDTIEVEYTPNTGYMLDYITVNGSTITGNEFTMPNEDVTIAGAFKVVDYNPLNLPADTLRAKFLDGYTPIANVSDVTLTQVSVSPNVWDITKAGGDWSNLLSNQSVTEVLGANSSNVTNMSYMFVGCGVLNKVALFDTSNVTNMSYMLGSCYNLTKVPVFDTSSVTNMNSMFASCVSLSNVNLTINGSANYIFYQCYNLKDVTINAANATSLQYAFAYCYILKNVSQLDLSSTTSISYMLYNCKSIEEVTIVNSSSLTYANSAFESSNLSHLNISDTSAITNVTYMFRYCYYLNNALEIYTQLSTQTTPPTTHTRTFQQAGTKSGNDQLSQIPSTWGGTGA